MRPQWLWDKDISTEEIRAILKDRQNERFINLAALLLSRNNTPKEVFDQYLDQKIFVENWTRIKRQMRKDSWNDPRIIFWQAVYERLVSEFKKNGLVIFEKKQERETIYLSREIGRLVKAIRIEEGLTQKDLAEKLDISQQLISRIENGRENLSLATFENISEMLGGKIHIEVSFSQGSPGGNNDRFFEEAKLSFQGSSVVYSTDVTQPNISFLESKATKTEI